MTRFPDGMRAAGRCVGALFFTIFGGCWLLLACAYAKRFDAVPVCSIAAVAILLATGALRLRSRAARVVEPSLPKEGKRRDDRVFGAINAVTYTAVFLLFLILPRFGLQNYIFPGFVLLVGLHFFPMPPFYQHGANLVTGGFMVVWAVVCAVAFRADGNRMAAFVAGGAGVALWLSAGWALRTAGALLARAGV